MCADDFSGIRKMAQGISVLGYFNHEWIVTWKFEGVNYLHCCLCRR